MPVMRRGGARSEAMNGAAYWLARFIDAYRLVDKFSRSRRARNTRLDEAESACEHWANELADTIGNRLKSTGVIPKTPHEQVGKGTPIYLAIEQEWKENNNEQATFGRPSVRFSEYVEAKALAIPESEDDLTDDTIRALLRIERHRKVQEQLRNLNRMRVSTTQQKSATGGSIFGGLGLW